MQKYSEFGVLQNPPKPFSQYDWAFNAEPTDRDILKQQSELLEKGGLTPEKQALAQYIVNRDGLRKALRTKYIVGQISNAFDQKDENAELLGWFNLFGLDDKSESIEGILASSCGGRSRQEALKYFRENYKPLITDGDAEKEKFEKLDDAGKRKFIENLRKADLSYTVEEGGDYGYSMSPNLGYYGLGKGRIKTKYRTMSDEEYSKWSAEYLNNTKYNRFWNAIYLAGEENAKIALSLSMAQDEDAVKAYIPQLQSLPIEDRAEIYALAREFNPEVSMWRLVKDDFIDSWRDIPRALVNAKDFLHTSASDLKQYVDEHGGLDAIMSDEKAKDEFRNKFFVAEHAVFVGVNRFALPFGGGDEALRDYSEQTYKVGAQMLENRARFDELQQALQTKYASEGEVMDGIIQGISFGIQFGQFVAISAASGGLGTGAEMAGIAAKTGRFANAANKVARLSFAASRKSSALTKLAMPYFGAMMQVDAQNAAREAGLPDEKAFIVGLAIGSANTVLEEIQFAVRQKNPFLGAKIVELMQKRKSFTWEAMKQSAIAGAKRRAGTFAEEYLVENLQNVVQDFGVYLAGTLNETEMREFNEVADGVLKQSIEMIVPLFTATNIGAGAIPFRALQTFATAERLKGDEKAVHDFNARMQLEEAAAKMSESGIDALTPDVAFKYATAQTEAERSKILYRLGLSSGERAKAKKALEDTKANIEGHAKELFESVKLAIEAKEPLPLLLTDGKNTASTEAMTAVIEEFAKAYGIESEVVLLDSAKGFSEQEMRAIARTYAAANNVSEEEGRRFVLNQMDGMRVGNKIYIIGDKARTPKRALEILKHESGHRGAEEIRAKKGFKSFLDGLLKEYGGEDLVRSAIGAVKGGAYQNLGRYDLAEEFMCMLAEKVKGKNELSKQELSAWQKIKDFFTTVLSGIPKEEGARDIFVANAIRSLWERNYGVDDDGGLDISGEYVSESAKPKETSYSQKRKAKKSFEQKLRELKLKEKKLSDSELELERERLEFERIFDSIPEDDITNRLALIDDADVEVLSDEHLEFAAYNGVEWAGDELVKRENERAQKEAKRQTDSLLDVMSQNGIKLPTPKAVIEHCKANGLPLSGTLFGEINDLYNSLNFYQKQKYFTGKYVDIDEVANVLRAEHNFPYEGSADFLSDFAENVWGKKETRFSVMPSSKYDQYRKELHRVMKLEQGSMLNASIKVGETPDILKMLGYEDLPLFLSGSVIWKVAFDPAKERFIPEETLGKIGEAIEDPMFIEKSASDSSQPNNSILIHTELEHNGEKLAVVIHLSKEKGGYTIHNIASVYARSQSQKDRVLDESRLLYLNTKKGLSEFNSELSLQSIHPENLKNLFVDGKVFTQDDLSQYKNSQNLKFSFRDTRTSAELDALNRQFRDVHERYKNGDQAAYEEAVKLVAEEARRKGYEVKVYHGTGSDGFDVAKADSSEEQNGEGAQAHGAGLYLAVSRDTAEGYRRQAGGGEFTRYELKGIDLYNTMLSPSARSALISAKKQNADIEELIKKNKDDTYRIETYRQIKAFLDAEHATIDDLKIIKEETGKVFDWFTNLNEDNMLDEDWEIIAHEKTVQEKYKKAYEEDILPILKESYGFDEDELESAKRAFSPNREVREIVSSARTIIGADKFREIMLKHGIKGITYDGRRDGRCYVSFEGGATVKLQDPFTFNDNGELIPLSKRFDSTNPDMRWSVKEDSSGGAGNLIVSHNISQANLIKAARLGGLPMPSLAVRRTDIEAEKYQFGDISLIAPKYILSDRAANTYQGDMWSPTYPQRSFVVNEKEQRRVIELLRKRYEKAGIEFDETAVLQYFYNHYFPEDFVHNLGDLHEAEVGEGLTMVSPDWQEEMLNYLNIKGEPKLFAGYTYTGKPRFVDETLENAVKLMKKRSLRGDAGPFSGTSSLKATLIKKLNLKQASKNRDAIKDMKTVEAEREKFFDERSAIIQELEKVGKYLEKYKSENPFTVLDRHATHIQEMADEGIEPINRDFYDGKIPEELKEKIRDFFERLANSSVPYFESKIKRAMKLDEFAGAVIPKMASMKVRQILEQNNIPYREYENEAERGRITDEFTRELDAGSGDIRWSVRAPTEAEIREAERQVEDVKAKWTNPDGSMKKGYGLAPNGKKSGLSERQWLLVRTPNFKKWFGDWENDPKNASKVVDENGEPLCVYHGTDWKPLMELRGGAVFQMRNASTDYDFPSGAYFSSSRKVAKTYGNNPYKIFLAIKNPYVLNANGRSYNDYYDELYSAVRNIDKEKYDGLVIKNIRDNWSQNDNGGNIATTYAAFNPTQIKSATDNVGTFSADNPDIRWSVVDAKPAPKDMPADINSPTLVEDMKQWALNYYKGKTVQMPDDKGILRAVSIDKRGIKEAMNHLRKRVNEDRKRLFVKTMPLIEELLEKAEFKSKPQNKHEGQKLDVYKYEVGFNDEGKNYLVDITIKENLQGKFYYDHNLTKIKTLGVQKNSDVKTSTSSVYELQSQNSSESQGENSKDARFSAADSDLERRKRAAAVKLAEQIYRQAGQDFNPEDGSASPMKATEEQIQDVYMSEMDFLDDDVDDVVNQAEAIAYRMASRGVSLKDMREEARRIEDEFQTSKIVEACIKDAQKKWEKDLRAAEKMRRQEKRDFEAQKRGITAWDADELAMENINLLDAITGDADAKEEIRKLLEKCKKWADAEGVSYDLMLEKFKATLAANFEGIASQFVRYRHIKSALESIAKILESESEEQAASRAEKLSQKLAEYLQRELSAFEEKEAKKAEKKAEREKREKEKKAAKKLKEAHARAVRMLLKFARSQKLPPHSQLEIKRKLPARIQAYLAQIKKVMPLSAEEVKSRFQFLSEKKGKLEVDGEDLNYKERYEMSALQFFGNIKEKSLPELLEIKAKLKELIEGQMDAQAQRLEEMEAEVAKTAEPLAQSLNLSPNAENADESGIYNTVKLGAKGVSMLEHRLRNIFLARKGLTEEQKKILEGWIADYAMRMSRASIEERRFKNAEMDWLRNTIRQIYGRKFTDKIGNPIEAQVFERLTKPSASLAKFADADAGGRVLSLGQVMQIFVSLEQWKVREAWAQAQERMLRLKADNAKIPEKFKAQYEYWERLFGAKAEMETFLSEEDKELIRALKRRYRERLDTINPVYERYNGLPMISSGLNYMPLVRDGELNIEAGGESNAIHLFPSYYAPRQISLKKLDEGANILQVFQSRTNTDAHFVNFAELIFQTKELWGNKALGGALKTRVPHRELNSLLAALRDPLKGEISRQKTVNADIANAISNWTAYFGLGFNLTSAGKQPMSFPAFMLKVPAKEWFGGFFEAVLHPMQFISDMREVWRSEYLQDRRKAGEINQVLADIEREAKSLKDEISAKKALRRLITKYSFAPIKFADSLAFVIGGTVVYKNFYKRYVETHAPEEASRLAMLDMLSVGEMTQQSAFIMNMSEGQRRDGGFGRMFSLFRTTNQQYMSFEVNAWNEFYARRDAASFKRFVKTLLLNHVILPGLFNGMGLLENLLLGDDMDDDDWDIFLQNLAICAFLDVFTGWWFSSVLKGAAQAIVFGGQNKITETMLPANAISRLSSVAFMAVKEIQKNGFADADWLKLLDSLGKATTPIYRTGRKLYQNITDGEEGVLW